jgi:hypothetical protein
MISRKPGRDPQMTYDQCVAILEEIRRRQGTNRPLVQVRAGSFVHRGRVAQPSIGSGGRHNPNSPYGVLVLEQMGLGRAPASLVQIANIPEDGLSGIEPR